MKTLYNAIRYHADVYIRTPLYVLPFLAFLVLLAGAYGTLPVQVVNSFAFSMSALYFAMIGVGISYVTSEDAVLEQILLLRLKCPLRHYIIKAAFLFTIGAAFSLFAVLFPLLLNVLTQFALYKRPVTAADIAQAFVLHCFVAYMGSSVGALFHPRIIREKKFSMLLVTFVALVGFAKVGIHRAIPFSAMVTWIFPPMSDIEYMLAGQATFSLRHMASIIGMTALYGTLVNALQIALLMKKKF